MAGWTSSAGERITASDGPFFRVYVIVPLQVLGDGGAQESEWLHCSHRAAHDGDWGESMEVSPEVHDHLHCFESVKLQVVKTAPDSQLLNLLSLSRLVTLDEAYQCGIVCKLQELDGGVSRCAVVICHKWKWHCEEPLCTTELYLAKDLFLKEDERKQKQVMQQQVEQHSKAPLSSYISNNFQTCT